MATPLKDLYNDQFYNYFISAFEEVAPNFVGKKFKKEIYDGNWEMLELKERMRKSADILALQLPKNFSESSLLLISFADNWHKTKRRGYGLELMFLCDYIERYGIHDVETSIKVMEKITTISSAEFAIRPFLNTYPQRMEKQMKVWAKHKHELVRRLATEGYRPRLPWGLAVPYLKKNPQPVFSILEILKNDSSETVRRSVANNLNDISKDHPELVIAIFSRWLKEHPETEKIVKHAARGLLKKGNAEVLKLFGAGENEQLNLTWNETLKPIITVGDTQTFSFTIQNKGNEQQKIRAEYVVYFLLKNGLFGRKVFFISEKTIAPKSEIQISKKHAFKPITTRTYYPGEHKMAILVNGKEWELGSFTLEM